ncbi:MULTISPECIES: response regulator [unclassified Paenibacillus]|uniref:response regulator n=1 Tax=unclassified Paenibacillus TaxID=185978 RepID=UPI001AE32CA6|nr:two-component system chemotaxis response regulator CheY [Paenibacillus sp. PvP091]MBP1168902.1 two-component system chemotaxis response regulator CheY [Paenibacillus sp. PvR098]MBP2439930.1 two-component system chemotaxis response regulator CheY [Paenibacillus sp. PvP052]
MRVLIVDDAAFMRMTLRKILESAGHEVAGEAVDGDDAILKYNELKPDLVTMDITMPRKDGIAATKAIRSVDPNAKILITSAMGQAAMVKEAVLSGAFDFIVKPVDEDRLLAAVTKASITYYENTIKT